MNSLKNRVVLYMFVLFLGAVSVAHAVLPVAGEVLHLDAGTLGLADGAAVSSWGLATQATAGLQPTYVASSAEFNGKAVVRFDGTDDWMALSPSPINVGSVTMFAVGKFILGGNNQYMVAGQDGGGDDRIRFAVDSGFEYRIGSSGWRAINTGAADGNVHIFEILSTAEGFLDGVSVGTAGNSSIEIPVALNIGSYNVGQKDFFSGDIAELIMYDRVLSNYERSEVGEYLETKYALNTDYGGVAPQVHSPNPSSGSQNVLLDAVLSFQAPVGVTNPAYDVYFGTSSTFSTPVSEGQSETTFGPYGAALMQHGQVYYWRVDVVGSSVAGETWEFITRPEPTGVPMGDYNGDFKIDMADVRILAELWLTSVSGDLDFDSDGKIDNFDFAHLSNDWKSTAPFPPSEYVRGVYNAGDFKVASDGQAATVYVDTNDYKVCQIAAEDLTEDVERVCGVKPVLTSDLNGLTGSVIFVGTIGKSDIIDSLIQSGKLDVTGVAGQWESFVIQIIDNPVAGVDAGLVIAGSDHRGTAYGVYDLSENMGVSPWYWWGDVAVSPREKIIVRQGLHREGPPSVKFRGIFLNDEDWGLQEWSEKTFEPEVGDIGPKTYARIFELLLRLKANHIWPAMHPCTKAFNHYEQNRVVANDYAIVMGASHCEPMLRNNVYEWYKWYPDDGTARGDWNYFTNPGHIYEYWEDRVKNNGQYENVYTVGMRGIHDGSMPGGSSTQQKIDKLEEVFADQRTILSDWVNPDPTAVPQIFVPYKEVLNLYNAGLQVPDDVVIGWGDDNHGYIRQLSNSQERQRGGGGGVYYHLSYWGGPHDYLWLCSTPPGLIWEEMSKAYDYNAREVWIANVGDIKPAEISMEFFLQMGWDVQRWNLENLNDFLNQWAWREFGGTHKEEIASIMKQYFQLGYARKPEHMGWNGVYPNTAVADPSLSIINYGDEAQKRLDAYDAIVQQAEDVYGQLPAASKDAYFQLVLYPVRCSALMNQKHLYAYKSRAYADQGRASANEYAQKATEAYSRIATETDYYNNTMAGGKWNHMMSYKPRGLPVFNMSPTGTVTPLNGSEMGVIIEGQIVEADTSNYNILPGFSSVSRESHFVDLFNKRDTAFAWNSTASDSWIELSKSSGTIATEQRLWVDIDWDAVPNGEEVTGTITFAGANKVVVVNVRVFNPVSLPTMTEGSYIEANGYVAIEAEDFTTSNESQGVNWKVIPGLGRAGDSVAVFPTTTPSKQSVAEVVSSSPSVEYRVYLWEDAAYKVRAYCIPTLAITSETRLRYAVSIDGAEPKIVDFTNTFLSSNWKQNVLQATAISESEHNSQGAGWHTVKIWMVDPGVVIDKLVLYRGNLPTSYFGPLPVN